MLLSVKLRNFKAFRDEQSIPLAPLTLIFGKNSSGKSSILHSLLFLRQSMDSLASGRPPVFAGEDVDLMSMRHTMHGQAKDESVDGLGIGVSFAWKSDSSRVADTFSRRLGPTLPDTHLGVQFDWPWNYKDGQVGEGSWAVTVGGEGEATFSGPIQDLRFGVRLPDITVVSTYMQQMFAAYGGDLWSIFDTNLEAWMTLFREPGMLRNELIDISQNEYFNILKSADVLRWINPTLLGDHERSVTASTATLIELITNWFKIYFNKSDRVSKSSAPDDVRFVRRRADYDSDADDSTGTDPEIEQSLYSALGPMVSPSSKTPKNAESSNGDVSRTLDAANDVIALLNTKKTEYGDHSTIDKFIQEYVFIHYLIDSPLAAQIIRYASDNSVSGLPDYPDVNSPLRVGPRRWVFVARDGLAGALGAISHVGPVREQLARLYIRDEAGSPAANEFGQAAVRFGASRTSQSRRTRGTGELRERLREQHLCDQVNAALSSLGIGYALSVEPQALGAFEDAGAEAVVLTDTVSNVRVGMQDVGYGVGQVIPLIAEVMTLGSRTLLIEQPELHLHPGLQANLGEVLVDAIKRFPDGQIIAETHSEHVILRIMRMVRDKQISSDKIHIIYVDSEHKRAGSITNIRINSYGEYVGTWPGGFFEERMNELF